jgi:hypothetical protein
MCIIYKSSALVNYATVRIGYFERKFSIFSRPNITNISYYYNDNYYYYSFRFYLFTFYLVIWLLSQHVNKHGTTFNYAIPDIISLACGNKCDGILIGWHFPHSIPSNRI